MSETIETCTAALQSDPGNWENRLALVEAFLAENRNDEAYAVVSEVTELPTDIESNLFAARAFGMLEPSTGVQILDGVIEADPNCVAAYYEKARLCFALGDADEASQLYEAAIAADPSLVDAEFAAQMSEGVSENSKVAEAGPLTPPALFSGGNYIPSPDDNAVVTEGPEISSIISSLKETLQEKKAEKEAEVRHREKVAKIQSFIVAIITLIGICILMILAVSTVPRPSPPQIVTSSYNAQAEDTLEKTEIKETKVTPTPTAATAMAMDITTVSSVSNLSMMSIDSLSTDIGITAMGSDFGSSMSFGNAAGGGSVMFFGRKSTGKRILFILDASASMKPEQVKLRDDELEKTLKSLKDVEYQVLLFAGGAYFADKKWGVEKKKGGGKAETEFLSPDGKYTFKGEGFHTFSLVDERGFKPPKWKKATSTSVRRTVEFVRESKKFLGTDWDNALRMGHMMDPPPDVIFFMSDGLDSRLHLDDVIKNNRRNGSPKINCVAMQTSKGSDNFSGISKKTKGSYVIVDKDGEPIDGFKYMKDPASFASRIKF